jgi:FkbM family methyltransferase
MREAEAHEHSAGGTGRAHARSTLIDLVGIGLSRFAFPGKWRLADLLGRVLVRVHPEAHCWLTRDQGLRVRFADRIERLMWAGCYERDLVTILRHSLRPGMVFADVGAHIGYFTVLASSLVSPGGRVYAFEADPQCFERLRENSRTLSGVIVHPMAVSDRVGEATFFASPDPAESGWGSLFPDGLHRSTRRVLTTTLDEWRQREAPGRIDFVKMDVEGAEYRVLRGAEHLIRDDRPVFFLEVNDVCLARDGRGAHDIVDFLNRCGYRTTGVLSLSSHEFHSIFAVPDYKAESIEMVQGAGVRLLPLGGIRQ